MSNASRWLSRHRKALVIVAAASIVAVLASVPLASSATSRTEGSGIPAAVTRQLTVSALRVAKGGGDARPAWIEAVTTTRDKALRVATPGDTIPGSARQTVYLVVMKGNFTLYSAPRPPHTHAPAGHYLAITFDPATFQMMDLGISNQAPPASFRSLGPVSNLTQQK